MKNNSNTKRGGLNPTQLPGPPQLSIQDIDQAVIDLFDKRMNFHLPSRRQRNQADNANQKVPVVFSGAELFVLDSNTNNPIRDEDGAIITPIISVTRRNISQDDYTGIVPGRYHRTFVHRRQSPTGIRKLQAPKQNGIIIGKNTNQVRHPVIEFISADRPEYYGISYDIIYWCSYQEHMNELIFLTQHAMDAPKMFYIQLDNGWKIEAFFNGEFTYQGNVDAYFEDERIIRYTFGLKVNAPIMSTKGGNRNVYKTTSPRTFAFTLQESNTINRLDEQKALNLLKFRNIHGSGADTVDEAILSPEDLDPYRRPRSRLNTEFNTPLFSTARLKELLIYKPTVATQKEYSISEEIKNQRRRGESQFVANSKEVLDLIFNTNVVLRS